MLKETEFKMAANKFVIQTFCGSEIGGCCRDCTFGRKQ